MDPGAIDAIFRYLAAETPVLYPADFAFVFGRADGRLAARTAELFAEDRVQYALLTGGIGKDSGALSALGCPEAIYIAGLLHWQYGIDVDRILVEPLATNAGECARLGIDTIVGSGRPCREGIVVAHATSLRRVVAVLETVSVERGFSAHWQAVGTRYPFDATSEADQREAVAELLRLADWPARGWCAAQPDLPDNLVRFAREVAVSRGP